MVSIENSCLHPKREGFDEMITSLLNAGVPTKNIDEEKSGMLYCGPYIRREKRL